MDKAVVEVAKSVLLDNGWTEVWLCCAAEGCPGIIHVGECLYDDNEKLVAVKVEYATCDECGLRVNIPSRLWIQ